jgi:hypothetical protein
LMADAERLGSCLFKREVWVSANRNSDHPPPNAPIPNKCPRTACRDPQCEAANLGISEEKLSCFGSL